MKSGRNEEKAEVVPAFGNPNRGLAAVLSYNGPSRTFGFSRGWLVVRHSFPLPFRMRQALCGSIRDRCAGACSRESQQHEQETPRAIF